MPLTGRKNPRVYIQSPNLHIANVLATYKIMNFHETTSNVMNRILHFQNKTIRWEGFWCIQDDDASADTYTIKVSKNDVNQALDVGVTEKSFAGAGVNIPIRVAFSTPFLSSLDDEMIVELKSDEQVVQEEMVGWLYGSYIN